MAETTVFWHYTFLPHLKGVHDFAKSLLSAHPRIHESLHLGTKTGIRFGFGFGQVAARTCPNVVWFRTRPQAGEGVHGSGAFLLPSFFQDSFDHGQGVLIPFEVRMGFENPNHDSLGYSVRSRHWMPRQGHTLTP